MFFTIIMKTTIFYSQNPYGVAVGGTIGHCLCTGLAVIGGRMIAQKISVRTGEIVIIYFFETTDLLNPFSGLQSIFKMYYTFYVLKKQVTLKHSGSDS